ncbi:transglutaminase-like domain-containing protein (plasmid) [Marinovum sp. KMM 9989]
MDLSIKTHLKYGTTVPCDVLLQVEALSDDTQVCRDTRLWLGDAPEERAIASENDIGTRRWVRAGPLFECRYETLVRIDRPEVDIAALPETPRMQIPNAVIPYLMPSRYCQSDLFLDFVAFQFADLTGGALVDALSTWVSRNFTYDAAASFAGTTATDSFASLAGVCRDYAHVLIALVRAAGLPARFVSVYAPDVVPQDFHAVVEVYLDGGWHIVDPTGMARSPEIARICAGRDAADVSFLTSYGWLDFQVQSVEVTRLSA